LAEKKQWDPQFTRRKKLQAVLNTLIPEFSVRLGGATSIEVRDPHETKRVIETLIACVGESR
jgi:phosphomannomutase